MAPDFLAVIVEPLPGTNDEITLVFSDAPEPDLRFNWGLASAFGSAGYWIGQHALIFGAHEPPDFSMGNRSLSDAFASLLIFPLRATVQQRPRDVEAQPDQTEDSTMKRFITLIALANWKSYWLSCGVQLQRATQNTPMPVF